MTEALLAGILLLAGNGFAQPERSTTAHCEELKFVSIPGFDLQVTRSAWIPASAQNSKALFHAPPYCRIEGTLNKRTGVGGKEYGISFAIALPEEWNHDFLMQGGGALNGTVQEPVGAGAAGTVPALGRHFAVVTTDTGHKGSGPFDGSFLVDQQAVLDFSYQAIGEVAQVSKQIIARYYGVLPKFSYYVGCSTGGREGMIVTQRYPLYFDGVVSGAPAMRVGFSNFADRWAASSLNRLAPKDGPGKVIRGGGFSDADRKLIIDSLLKACDARDGIIDGMVFDPVGCTFDPAVLTCTGPKTESCLTGDQVGAVKRAFGGPKDSRGFQPYPGFFYDTGIAATNGIPGLLMGAGSPVGSSEVATEQDVDREELTASNALTDSVYRNLSTFSGHGGKLIFYHGVSDPWFSSRDTIEYFDHMAEDNGGPETVKNWSRLFLIPGMGHCAGGASALDTFDMLTAITNWVEKKVAPDAVIATGKAFPGRTRPLCAYPEHAQYSGSGNSEDAASFVCRR